MIIQEFYVIQRCWHSGPHILPPVDYLRLFEFRADAEQTAFHSAHAWSRQQAKQSKHSKHCKSIEPVVRTLLLPPTSDNNGSTGKNAASYGFVSHGSLFWARPVQVALTEDLSSTKNNNNNQDFIFDNAQSNPQQNSNNSNSYNNNNNNSNINNNILCSAYVVITNGVIGGTGNINSRRGVEIQTGRAFLGNNNEARTAALQVAQRCNQTNTNSNAISKVVSLPIGKPTTTFNSSHYLSDWPYSANISFANYHQQPQHHDVVMDMTNNKRDNSYHYQHTTAAVSANPNIISPFQMQSVPVAPGSFPTPKRRRLIADHEPFFMVTPPPSIDEDMAMCP